MTDTLRDKLIQKGWVTPFNADTLVRLIEEHYADEPAVPEGREPAAVTGKPSDQELESFLVDVAAQHGDIYWAEPLVLARAVLARWGNPEPAPPADGEVAVSVSERLPDEGDPTECRMPDGSCWWFDPHGDGGWYLDTFSGNYTHWLPAHALPLPEVSNG